MKGEPQAGYTVLCIISHLSHGGLQSQNFRNNVLSHRFDCVFKGQEKLGTLGSQGFLGE